MDRCWCEEGLPEVDIAEHSIINFHGTALDEWIKEKKNINLGTQHLFWEDLPELDIFPIF